MLLVSKEKLSESAAETAVAVAGSVVGAVVAAGSAIAVGSGAVAAGEQAETKSMTINKVMNRCRVKLNRFFVNMFSPIGSANILSGEDLIEPGKHLDR